MDPNVIKSIFQFRILGDHGIGQIARVGLCGVKIGRAGDGIFHGEIKVLVIAEVVHLRNVVGLAPGSKGHGLSAHGYVFWLDAIGFLGDLGEHV